MKRPVENQKMHLVNYEKSRKKSVYGMNGRLSEHSESQKKCFCPKGNNYVMKIIG